MADVGKTLTTLALALATKSEPLTAGEANATLIGTSSHTKLTIVCPLSVLGNWEKQIKDHVVNGNLSFYTYHGATKGITAAKLAKYDVVLTTYQTVATDITGKVDRAKQYYDSDDDKPKGKKKQKTASKILANVQWRRIVADEGHVLKNPKSQMTLAYAGLKAARRWICTGKSPLNPLTSGTPIVNSPADLGSLLTCIQVCKPLDQVGPPKTLLTRPTFSNPSSSAPSKLAIPWPPTPSKPSSVRVCSAETRTAETLKAKSWSSCLRLISSSASFPSTRRPGRCTMRLARCPGPDLTIPFEPAR
jgi:SWI/SNF-related matrix-associated actin-dependent regulator of chromatin subfamily A3